MCNVLLILSSQRAVAETKTKGGLLIPETAQKSPLEATVVAAGPGARNATTGFYRTQVSLVRSMGLVVSN